ncbi:SDR family NAD(P)-dependent oxidoreductase [Cesiribacter andamanensis]|uniref:Levodione reductase n=1 Tax=Cesiribacter andamanensis AMV16 TaxID=1279009 RepID=M7N5F2_9BACT|nr:SDR family oxidoreductase [Cesiribacter andamanensis]EMR02456.1 Levodione reductase [Cesiribacter andamanensis AMV16]
MPHPSLRNSQVVLTGGASGIGRQMALQAAARGAAVLATDIDQQGLQQTVELGREQGLVIERQLLDVADRQAVFHFAEAHIPRLQGRRLVLINNAGVGLYSGSFADTELEDFDWLLRINLWGPIWMTKAFYPYLLQQGQGHVVSLSSIFGLGGVANQSAYCTSKFGLRGFMESLRMELLGTGVKTLLVLPGGVKTNIARNATPRGNVATAAMHAQTVASFEREAPTSAESAARQILNAIEKGRARLVIGRDGRAFDTLSRLFPVLYTKLLKKRIEQVFTNPYTSKEA